VDFRSRNTTFSDMAAYRLENAGLTTKNAEDPAASAVVNH
jgi:hypothetical protein